SNHSRYPLHHPLLETGSPSAQRRMWSTYYFLIRVPCNLILFRFQQVKAKQTMTASDRSLLVLLQILILVQSQTVEIIAKTRKDVKTVYLAIFSGKSQESRRKTMNRGVKKRQWM